MRKPRFFTVTKRVFRDLRNDKRSSPFWSSPSSPRPPRPWASCSPAPPCGRRRPSRCCPSWCCRPSLLAGIFRPVEAIPAWLRPLSCLVPPTYAVDAARSVMLRGWGIDKIWIDIAALPAMAAFFLFLAVLSLRTRKG